MLDCAWKPELQESLASACFKIIKSKTWSARCGRSDSMEPADPIQRAQPLTLIATDEYTPTLARIPAGWFLMGCDAGQDNEKPVHRVWVDEFLLASRQVTNADYQRFIRDIAPSSAPPLWSEPAFSHPGQPVVGVSRYEATQYCVWLSDQTDRGADRGTERGKTGSTFRLPTEAEWERAA